MDNDNKTPSGAPADDTTSALFVSARKRQLEQQEAERRAREKEEQRVAAEAEVRRLEQEVEERRRQAEEEARRIEQESLARQARQPTYMAGQGVAPADTGAAPYASGSAPDRASGASYQSPPPYSAGTSGGAPYGAADPAPGASPGGNTQSSYAPPAPQSRPPQQPGAQYGAGGSQPGQKPPSAVGGLLANKKMLAIIGGGAVVVIALVVVLIIALSGNKGGSSGASVGGGGGSSGGRSPEPSGNTSGAVSNVYQSHDVFGYYYLNGEEDNDSLYFYSDGTMEVYYRGNGATETWGFTIEDDVVTILGTVYGVEGYSLAILDDNTLLDQFGDTYSSPAYSGGDDYYQSDLEYHDLNSKIYFRYPADWSVSQQPGASTYYAPVRVTRPGDSTDMMLVYNFTPEFHEFMSDGRSGMDNLIYDFAELYFWDRDWDTDDLYNIHFGDSYFNFHGNEVIVMTAENDYEYFAFVIVKKFTEPQQLVAVAIEATSQAALADFVDVAGSMDLYD